MKNWLRTSITTGALALGLVAGTAGVASAASAGTAGIEAVHADDWGGGSWHGFRDRCSVFYDNDYYWFGGWYDFSDRWHPGFHDGWYDQRGRWHAGQRFARCYSWQDWHHSSWPRWPGGRGPNRGPGGQGGPSEPRPMPLPRPQPTATTPDARP